MIEYLYANNYKSFVNFRIEFDKSNLLIGKNGTGKSNVLFLIASIRDVINGSIQSLSESFPPSTTTRWMKSNIQSFELGIADGDSRFAYQLEIEQDPVQAKTVIRSEKITCDGQILFLRMDGSAQIHDDDNNVNNALVDPAASGVAFVPAQTIYSRLIKFKVQISNIILCTPNPKVMKDTVQNDIYIPDVSFSNIASTFAGIVLTNPDIYGELVETYKEASPEFCKASISVDLFFKRLKLDYKYNDVDCPYFFNELSDGERMLFALYILLYGFIKQGKTILLDEPDNYLSLREIQPWCVDVERELSENGQCIMISHHPEIIDYMAETDGIWMTRIASGESKIIDKPSIGVNEDLLTYSEMIARGLLDEAE